MREANDVVLDHALYLWISQRRRKKDPISSPLLCEKTLELNEKLGGLADFKAGTEGYSRDDVYDVDETGVNWKALPRKSIASKREFTAPGFKKLREREGKTDKVLLILDNAPRHPPVEILNVINDDFSVMYFPPNALLRWCNQWTTVSSKSSREFIGIKYYEDYFWQKMTQKVLLLLLKAQYQRRLLHVSRSVGLARKTEPEKCTE
ncbi:jerky-like protein [Trichonephila clavipes]|nr:jerky-like protein [Trichonephila clavipes]